MRLVLCGSLVVLATSLGCGDSTSTSETSCGGSCGNNSDVGGTSAGGAGAGGSSAGGAPQGGASSAGGDGSGGTLDTASSAGGANPGFTAEAIALCQVINDYRVGLGLPSVPRSVALMTVAQAHVDDLTAHPETVMGACNLHSWSDDGPWTGCCYTPDHAEAQCMWSKPPEITAGWGANAYTAPGYEISASGVTSAEQSLTLWQGSPGHHDVIINAGIWEPKSPWPAIGCAMTNGYAVVWFGDATDTQTF